MANIDAIPGYISGTFPGLPVEVKDYIHGMFLRTRYQHDLCISSCVYTEGFRVCVWANLAKIAKSYHSEHSLDFQRFFAKT